MAMPDHKALARPSFPTDGTFSRLPSPLYGSADAAEFTPCITADIAAALRVLQHMQDQGEAVHQAVLQGLSVHPEAWPLMGPHTSCLEVAMHYLTQYGRVLDHE